MENITRSIFNIIISHIKLLLMRVTILIKTKHLTYKRTLSMSSANRKTSLVQCLWKRSDSKKLHEKFNQVLVRHSNGRDIKTIFTKDIRPKKFQLCSK